MNNSSFIKNTSYIVYNCFIDSSSSEVQIITKFILRDFSHYMICGKKCTMDSFKQLLNLHDLMEFNSIQISLEKPTQSSISKSEKIVDYD